MSFIEFKNVCKMYPGSKVNTVDDFNLNIEEKEFVAFVGPWEGDREEPETVPDG